MSHVKHSGKRHREKRKKRQPVKPVIGAGICLVLCILAVVFLAGKISGNHKKEISGIDEPEVIDISNEVVKGKIPLFLQSDVRWGDEMYGDDKMEINGCGPTCLSMVLCGLSGTTKYDPLTVAEFAEFNGYYVKGSGSAWTLMSEGAELLGLTVHEVIFDEDHIRKELEAGRPIICVVGPGDFTTDGHFIILYDIDSENQVRIKDPNSKERSAKTWELEKIMPQIRNLWSYSYET